MTMPRQIANRIAVALVALAMAGTAQGYATDCWSAQNNLRAARAKVEQATERHSACLAKAAPDKTCSREFRRLKIAQAALETAAKDVDNNCPD